MIAQTDHAPCRLLLIDDHPVFREGLKKVLDTIQGVEIVGEADCAEDALHKIRELAPDLVLLDLALPGMDGFSILESARGEHPDTHFVILTSYDDQAYIDRARELGADGFLLKDSAIDDFIEWLKRIRAGGQCLKQPREHTHPVLPPPLPASLIARLTETEKRILAHVAQSRTSKEIAGELGISYRTVQNHRANICSKLGLKGPNQLLSLARRYAAKI